MHHHCSLHRTQHSCHFGSKLRPEVLGWRFGEHIREGTKNSSSLWITADQVQWCRDIIRSVSVFNKCKFAERLVQCIWLLMIKRLPFNRTKQCIAMEVSFLHSSISMIKFSVQCALVVLMMLQLWYRCSCVTWSRGWSYRFPGFLELYLQMPQNDWPEVLTGLHLWGWH